MFCFFVSFFFFTDVDIDIIASFNRMKSLSTDVSKIAQIMRESSVVEVSEDGLRVRRKNHVPETDLSAPRTIYAVRAYIA